MRNWFYSIALALFFLLGSPLHSNAQKEPSMADLMAVFDMQFSLVPPDTTFQEMEGGVWVEEATQSKIACSALPFPFEQVLKDSSSFESNEGMKVLSKENMEIGGVQGFLVRAEVIPPAEEKNRESFYMLMFMRPLNKTITLNLNAAYPKSQQERLYPKMLAAFATAREKGK